MTPTIAYFSATGHTEKVALYFLAQFPEAQYINLTDHQTLTNWNAHTIHEVLILVLPIHAQNIPLPIRGMIHHMHARHYVLTFTYGSIAPGNIAESLGKIWGRHKIIGVAYLPFSHSYGYPLEDPDLNLLGGLCRKIASGDTEPAVIPHQPESPLKRVLERYRTHKGIRLTHLEDRCVACHICFKTCPVQAITPSWHITKACIRCLRCVAVCPTQAWQYDRHILLTRYIKKRLRPRKVEVVY
jgi:ferredoxin